MPPQTGSDLVVSHHLAGFGSLQVPGLLHPGTGQDSLRFRSRATRRPKTPALHVPSPAARSHPSKSSPRWQPCRIAAAVAPSAFTRRSCLSPTSRSTRRSLVSIRWTHRVSEDPHPSHRKVAPSVPRRGDGPPWTADRLDRSHRQGAGSSPVALSHTLRFGPPPHFLGDEPRATLASHSAHALGAASSFTRRRPGEVDVTEIPDGAVANVAARDPSPRGLPPVSSWLRARTMVEAVSSKLATVGLSQDLPHRGDRLLGRPGMRPHPCDSPGASRRLAPCPTLPDPNRARRTSSTSARHRCRATRPPKRRGAPRDRPETIPAR